MAYNLTTVVGAVSLVAHKGPADIYIYIYIYIYIQAAIYPNWYREQIMVLNVRQLGAASSASPSLGSAAKRASAAAHSCTSKSRVCRSRMHASPDVSSVSAASFGDSGTSRQPTSPANSAADKPKPGRHESFWTFFQAEGGTTSSLSGRRGNTRSSSAFQLTLRKSERGVWRL